MTVSHNVCRLQLSAKHTLLLTSVKQSKNHSCPHRVPISEGRRKTVKSQRYCYMIVCINTSRARLYPLGCVWTPPNCTAWSEREACLLLWRTENGSFFKWVQHEGTRVPSAAVVVTCSLLDWHFQVQIVCECCGRLSSGVQDSSAGPAAAAQNKPVSFPLLDKLWCHYANPATCVPPHDPVFPSVTPLPHPPCPWTPPPTASLAVG